MVRVLALRVGGLVLCSVLGALSAQGAVAAPDSIETLRSIFASPPREYSTGPLWVWNDRLTEDQIRSTLRDLAGQNVKQAWVHPRPGLMTPYLSEEWFALWKVALDEAEQLDMNIWIYDENSYPSGFAGGFVPKAMPESRGLGIQLRSTDDPASLEEPLLAVYRSREGGLDDVTADRDQTGWPEGHYLVVVQTLAKTSPWFGGTHYVDVLRPGVVEKFLDITMEAYRREVGDQFGQRIPGVFTDEPHLAPADGLHWTPDLPEQFEARWGYDLRHHLISLWRPEGDWQRVRHNYYQTLLDLFIERWAKPFYEYCEANDLEFTGHYWEHGWPTTRIAPDNMAMYAWHQRPAIDTLFNQYSEKTDAQFGNVRAVMELASAADQLGRERTLCEAYGGSGWDARFEDFKRIGDWLQVLGVNTINEHLSQITNRGARKADYPPSFSYHAPWFDSYHVLADYFTRVSAALSAGVRPANVLVIEPTSTAWMYQGVDEELGPLGADFQALVTNLAQAQVEFDLGSEDIIARQGLVEGGRFHVGERAYRAVVLPPHMENVNTRTLELLERFLEADGAVILGGEAPPLRVDGQVDDRPKGLARFEGWKQVEPADVLASVEPYSGVGFPVRRSGGDQGILYHHRRRFSDGDLVFLVNTSLDQPTSGRIETARGGVERWDPATGQTGLPYPFAVLGEAVATEFDLPPGGSLLLFFPDERRQPEPQRKVEWSRVPGGEDVTIVRDAPNVLTLDYVDVTVDGETQTGQYFYAAARAAFRAHGLEENPWDHAVQFGDELISKTFSEDSGFEAVYTFTIQADVPRELFFVMERADLYTIACNGQPIAAKPGDWWLDRSFGKIDIRACAQVGENRIKVAARPFTMYHELEPAYVIGAFALETAERGFVIAPDRPLELGPWKSQGHPLYGDAVSYTRTFSLEADRGSARHEVRLTDWYGSVARVSVNGKPAGHIWHAPWACDVTDLIREGDNAITVTVIGTPKNPLGPHHGDPPLGFAGPNSFRKGPVPGPPPGAEYDTLDYGLFEPFVLVAGRR
jgi:hypothetical protein